MDRLNVKRTTRTKTNLFIISHLTNAHAERLIRLADVAAELRQPDTATRLGSALSRLGCDEAGAFYQALARNRSTGTLALGNCILSELSEHASPLWRAKAMVACGSNAFEWGDYLDAQGYYTEARRLSANSLVCLHTAEMTAQIRSREGDHKQALKLLAKSAPLACGIHALNHRNSLAVELNALGRVDEARNVLAPCLASPYRIYYPEWSHTATEIHQAPRHLIYKPAYQPDKIACVTSNIARAYMDEFTRYRKKKQEVAAPERSTHYEITLANKILEGGLTVQESDFVETIRELVKTTHPSYEKLKEGADILERLFKQGDEE